MMNPKGMLYGVRVAGLAAAVTVVVFLTGCGEVTPSPATGTAMLTPAPQHGDMPEVVVRASRR